MRLNDLKIRCYAEKEKDGSWFAACIDLNLVAQEDSFDLVRAKLHGIISDYLREALSSDAQYIDDLIPRSAPLYFQLRYHLVPLLNFVHFIRTPQRFMEHLPLVPA